MQQRAAAGKKAANGWQVGGQGSFMPVLTAAVNSGALSLFGEGTQLA